VNGSIGGTEFALLCGQAMIGTVFALSLAGKVVSGERYRGFAAAAADLAPRIPARASAGGVVATEAAIVVLVSARPTRAAGLTLAAALLVAFAAAIVLTLRRRRQVTCQCFGSSTVPLGRVHVVRNLALSVVAGCLALGTATESAAGSGAAPASVAIAVAAGAIGAVAIARTDDIVALFRPIS
jgi:Methylamine utilisation protein MauE